ncbi:MAG: NAD-dependent epimerase/dehydratase family protein [Sediminicola sp.]
MGTKEKIAIILGATGLTGGLLLQFLLEDARYSKIILFSRYPIGFSHPKMQEHLVDMLDLDAVAPLFKADEVYCCIGTTKAKTKDRKKYREIDFGIPVSAAKLCLRNGIDHFLVISAMGANSGSSLFYNRTKGEMEREVLRLGIGKVHILRPSLISGKREELRLGEWVFKQLMKLLNLVFVGPLEKYRSIAPETIAKAMIWLANNPCDISIVESDKIKKIGQ